MSSSDIDGGPASGGHVAASGTPTEVVDVTMPQMGVSVSEGTIVEWKKQVGDWVAYEETICEISTDKIDTEVPSPVAGRLAEILVDVGTTVDVGTVLAKLATDAKPGEAHASEIESPPPPASGDAAAATGDAPAPAAPAAAAARVPVRDGGARFSPVVSRMAAEHGLDLAQIAGTGRNGRVTKKDVLAYLDNGGGGAAAEDPPMHIESPYRPDPDTPVKAKAAAPAAAPPAVAAVPTPTGKGEPLSRMRKSIGDHMKRSLEIAAHCTTIVECDLSGVERRRREIGATYLPILARCVVDALREYPLLNAWLEGDTFTQHPGVGLGVAVSLGDDGLIVPVIHDAQDLSDEGLARRIKDLARRARSKELVPDDVQGGTFTITNPGAFGAIAATPIINQPQVAILDLEAIVKRPVVITDAAGNDAIAIRPMTNLCMSWDHRAIDGVYAAQFLTAVRRRVEAV